MANKSKVQVLAYPIAATTIPGKRALSVELDSAYKTVRGFYVIRNSGTDYLKIEIIAPNATTIQDNVNISHLQVGPEIKIKDRFFVECPFENKGKTIVNLQNFVNATALQDTDILFLLDNHELDHQPKK